MYCLVTLTQYYCCVVETLLVAASFVSCSRISLDGRHTVYVLQTFLLIKQIIKLSGKKTQKVHDNGKINSFMNMKILQ